MSASPYGTPQDWTQLIAGIGEGSSGAMKGLASSAASKAEAKEAKRRTMANLLSQAMKRNRGLFVTGQQYSDEMNDTKSQAMQEMARGFVSALQGSTGY